ncbi:MAG TPA: M14 family zinc carboxypeptidase [Gemmatimonadaceae bacterium]|nr:M14 family zinc carboxypeptidase [Gemmatimonadaceae bacterium]
MRSLRLAFLLITIAAPLGAQALPADSIRDDRNFSFYDRGPYRQTVPRPETVLGYSIGEMNTQYAAQERVLLAIADAAKDRVRVEEFGSSYERRTMRTFIVSSPENIARLDAIRSDLDKLADPRTASAGELDQIAARTPAVVFLSHSVHGNESPGFESAIQLLYQLAASEEPATVNALRNTIVVINPSSNPDGHERFTVWYNSINVRHPDPNAIEHDEPWSVQGRFNHYRFDMNRDVMASTQREVQGLMRAMLRWHPMVAADLHGVTERFFFPPVAKAINANFGDLFTKWMEILGRANATAFDRYGWMYYSRDVFDFYAVFYWDTWPSLMGAAGMTFETDGGGWKGILWRRDDGTLVSFRDGIAKHWVASMATIEQTAARREERVRDFLRFRQSAIADGRTGAMKRVVLVPGRDPGRAAELVSALLRAGIEVRATEAELSSSRAHAFRDDAVRSQRFATGAYVIDLAQPNGRVAKAFLEPTPAMDSAFVRAQIAKFVRNVRRGRGGVREGYEFYDLTAWSLPVAFGVEAYWTEDAAPVRGRLLSLPAEEPTLPEAQQQARRVGGELVAVEIPGGIVAGAGAKSAYVFPPDRNGASRLAYHLMKEGYRLAVATQPIEADGKHFPRGTWVVRVARNDTTVASRLDVLARESGVEVTGVNSAFTTAAQFGIGSEATLAVTPPRIALVGDEGISQTGYGAVWWNFERRYGIDFMPISLGYLANGDLTKLNVIIIPSASPGALTARLGKDGVEHVKRWIREGGTLITMGGSTAWAARPSTDLTSGRAVGADEDTTKADTPPADSAARRQAPERTAEDLIPVKSPSSDDDAPAPLPGTHFDVVLDRTHWLTFGYEDPRLTVMLDGDFFLKLSKDGANVAVFPSSGRLHRAGFIFPDNTERLLRGTALLVEESLGDGHVVAFVNEPMFRGWWRALDKLVLNAVLLGPSM